ncbi:MAG: phosphatidylglycerol lysyltransferase domain-containing protein [Eubacteriales bacterium]
MLARGEDAMPMDMNKFRRAFPLRLLYPALLFCGAAAVAFHAGQASQFGMTLRHSIPIWIILAVMLQIIFLVNLSFFYRAVYLLVGLSEKAHFQHGLKPAGRRGGGAEDGPRERAVSLFYNHFNRFYSFKSLRKYKEKFGPRWEPRYLIYSSTLTSAKNCGGNSSSKRRGKA